MLKSIVVYYHPNCIYCNKLMDWLKEKKLNFVGKNVHYPKFQEEFNNRKGRVYPLTILTLTTGKEVEVLGFNKAKFEEYLAL